MILLRELQEKDAPLMLEWMHDAEVQRAFKKNMLKITIDEAVSFCRTAVIPPIVKNGDSLHFAIVNEEDEYLGTISLKNIDLGNGTAEYSVATRKKAQRHGVAFEATGLVLKKAFEEYKLHRVYLNVLADNESAIKLYERCGFTYEGEFRQHLNVGGKFVNWKWYGMLNNEYYEHTIGR